MSLTLTSVEQLILDRLATQLDAIDGVAPYHVNVQSVLRAREGVDQIEDFPALKLVHRGTTFVRRLQCQEGRIQGEVLAFTEEHDRPARNDTLALLRADVETALHVDETFGGLAVGVTLGQAEEHQGDATDPAGAAILTFEVQYRTALGDPYTLAVL